MIKYFTREAALKAVKKNGSALGECLPKFRNDEEIVTNAIYQDGGESFKFASKELKKDPFFMLQSVERAPKVFKYTDRDYLIGANFNFTIDAMLKNDYVILFARERELIKENEMESCLDISEFKKGKKRFEEISDDVIFTSNITEEFMNASMIHKIYGALNKTKYHKLTESEQAFVNEKIREYFDKLEKRKISYFEEKGRQI